MMISSSPLLSSGTAAAEDGWLGFELSPLTSPTTTTSSTTHHHTQLTSSKLCRNPITGSSKDRQITSPGRPSRRTKCARGSNSHITNLPSGKDSGGLLTRVVPALQITTSTANTTTRSSTTIGASRHHPHHPSLTSTHIALQLVQGNPTRHNTTIVFYGKRRQPTGVVATSRSNLENLRSKRVTCNSCTRVRTSRTVAKLTYRHLHRLSLPLNASSS